MSRRLLDAVVRLLPAGCCLAVHHFKAGAPSLKSGRPIKASEDECGLAPAELSRRYAAAAGSSSSSLSSSSPSSSSSSGGPYLSEVLLDETGETVEGRPMCSYVGRK